MKRTPEEKKKYSYKLRLHDIEHNVSVSAYFTQKGAELWDCFARRGYVGLIWDEHSPAGGYYYKIADVKKAMKKLWDEGSLKQGGYFYEKQYFIC